jgi:hypothetical protein
MSCSSTTALHHFDAVETGIPADATIHPSLHVFIGAADIWLPLSDRLDFSVPSTANS